MVCAAKNLCPFERDVLSGVSFRRLYIRIEMSALVFNRLCYTSLTPKPHVSAWIKMGDYYWDHQQDTASRQQMVDMYARAAINYDPHVCTFRRVTTLSTITPSLITGISLLSYNSIHISEVSTIGVHFQDFRPLKRMLSRVSFKRKTTVQECYSVVWHPKSVGHRLFGPNRTGPN